MTDIEATTETAPAPRLLKEIAADIFANWQTMRERGENHPAWGYADAMRELDTVNDRYFADGARDIVQRFLSEARVWRGETARAIKAELHALLDA
jgi:hypothetical protein